MKPKTQPARSAVSPARAAAFDILLRVERESSYAAELLHSRTGASLTTIDHALATELVMGVLRWRSLLDTQIARASAERLSKLDVEILIALRLAVYQFHWLSRVPARAAINESVELVKRARKRSAAPFVNAVLRKLTGEVSDDVERTPPVIDGDSAEALAASSAHPMWLVERWIEGYGLGTTRELCRYDQCVPVTSIRLRRPEAEEQLCSEGIELAPGAFLASARQVRKGDITGTSAFRRGGCVVQDEASQLVSALVGLGGHVLDCCAAPGGKTLAMADGNRDAGVVAVELYLHRARLLRRLVHAHGRSVPTGAGSINVVAADARNLPFVVRFDRVLADVPCSGTGTLSRNPEIKWRLRPEDLSDLQVRQGGILRAAMDQVAPAGRVIYSTCSLEREENEEVVEGALAQTSGFRVVDCAVELQHLQRRGDLVWANISSLTHGPYLRTVPGVHPCDGFFAAILERI